MRSPALCDDLFQPLLRRLHPRLELRVGVLPQLDELGPFDLYGYGQASFNSESKWDGLDEFYIQEYDAESDSIRVVEAVVVDR